MCLRYISAQRSKFLIFKVLECFPGMPLYRILVCVSFRNCYISLCSRTPSIIRHLTWMTLLESSEQPSAISDFSVLIHQVLFSHFQTNRLSETFIHRTHRKRQTTNRSTSQALPAKQSGTCKYRGGDRPYRLDNNSRNKSQQRHMRLLLRRCLEIMS